MSLELSRIRALCFDVDGTLSDTDDLYVQKVQRFLPRFLCNIFLFFRSGLSCIITKRNDGIILLSVKIILADITVPGYRKTILNSVIYYFD